MIEALRGDLMGLEKAGVIDKVTMREFNRIAPPQVGDEQDIKPFGQDSADFPST